MYAPNLRFRKSARPVQPDQTAKMLRDLRRRYRVVVAGVPED
jgi:hypothetical protein